jgi:hypothetical protein
MHEAKVDGLLLLERTETLQNAVEVELSGNNVVFEGQNWSVVGMWETKKGGDGEPLKR